MRERRWERGNKSWGYLIEFENGRYKTAALEADLHEISAIEQLGDLA